MNNEQKEQMIKTNAFDGVSFDHEKMLDRFISDIESEDNKIDEICQQYGVDSQKLKDKHFRLALDYLYAQSRINTVNHLISQNILTLLKI